MNITLVEEQKEVIETMPPELENKCSFVNCNKEAIIFNIISIPDIGYCQKHSKELNKLAVRLAKVNGG